MIRYFVFAIFVSAPFYAIAVEGATFERHFDVARMMEAVEAPELTRALEAAGCTVAGSFDMGEATIRTDLGVMLRAESTGTRVFARCAGNEGVVLTRHVRVDRVVNGRVRGTLSSEIDPRSPGVGDGPVMRLGRSENGPAAYAMTWRDKLGQQHSVVAYDKLDHEHAERTLVPLQVALRRSID